MLDGETHKTRSHQSLTQSPTNLVPTPHTQGVHLKHYVHATSTVPIIETSNLRIRSLLPTPGLVPDNPRLGALGKMCTLVLTGCAG